MRSFGIADPDGGRQARREADEPGVGVQVGRAGLAAGRAADVRVRAGAALDVLLEDLGGLVGHAVREDLRAVRAPAARQLGLAGALELDLGDRGRPVAVAAGGDRRVRGRHLQRRDAVLEAAERLGRIAVHVAALDAHVDRGVGHLVGPEVERELDVDRVVGPQRRLDEVHVAAAGAAVGLDLERRPVLGSLIRVGDTDV